MDLKDAPAKLRPFISLGFDYHSSRLNGEDAYGDCLFCGARNKLYVNTETGLWDCKAGKCQMRGNTYSFIQKWYNDHLKQQDNPADGDEWIRLANDRQLSPELLKAAGIVFDGEQWHIPVRNASGSIINLRRYTIGQALHGLAGLDASLFGADSLGRDELGDRRIFICEGEWDAIAFDHLLQRDAVKGVVVAAPGAGIWKEGWADSFTGRKIVVAYDNDGAGRKGLDRLSSKLRARVSDFQYVQWPVGLPDGFDIRDFVTRGGTWSELEPLITPYLTDDERHQASLSQTDIRPVLAANETNAVGASASGGRRPSFTQVVKLFSQHLHMSEDMVMALKVIFAVVLSNQIEGDPLWVHIVSPPGTAKTELLMPLTGCASCYFASTVTAHSLVSGFMTSGNNDPSLLPKLNGKTFVLKDFTEILNMPRVQKDEIYGTLRGAYDGSVQKHYGNGLTRDYKIRFNMLSGVTHAVFGERAASLGERFLLFHLVKGVGFHSSDAIRSAISNVGKEGKVRQELHDIVRDFVEVKIEPDAIPEMPEDMIDRIIALATLVSMLRANVDRVQSFGGQDKLLYRPQHEMGTRLGKQLTKMAYGLSLVNSPPTLGEEEYKVICRVALDTCVGFNLEAIAYLTESKTGVSIEELCEKLDIPHSTLRDQLEDLTMLGSIVKERVPNPHGRGAPRYHYHASDTIKHFWKLARLSKQPEVKALPEKREVVRKIRRVRRHSKPDTTMA